VAWKEELSRPLREAKEFLTTVESQLNSITSTGPPLGALISAGNWPSAVQLAPLCNRLNLSISIKSAFIITSSSQKEMSPQ
jgi:hypothetical protein